MPFSNSYGYDFVNSVFAKNNFSQKLTDQNFFGNNLNALMFVRLLSGLSARNKSITDAQRKQMGM